MALSMWFPFSPAPAVPQWGDTEVTAAQKENILDSGSIRRNSRSRALRASPEALTPGG